VATGDEITDLTMFLGGNCDDKPSDGCVPAPIGDFV
jgi:hypothetical protein